MLDEVGGEEACGNSPALRAQSERQMKLDCSTRFNCLGEIAARSSKGGLTLPRRCRSVEQSRSRNRGLRTVKGRDVSWRTSKLKLSG